MLCLDQLKGNQPRSTVGVGASHPLTSKRRTNGLSGGRRDREILSRKGGRNMQKKMCMQSRGGRAKSGK